MLGDFFNELGDETGAETDDKAEDVERVEYFLFIGEYGGVMPRCC
jgi:hypothetical protein